MDASHITFQLKVNLQRFVYNSATPISKVDNNSNTHKRIVYAEGDDTKFTDASNRKIEVKCMKPLLGNLVIPFVYIVVELRSVSNSGLD